MILLPGRMLGDRYEIIEKIGSGGMSDVYKAKCHKLNRYVAIKVLKDEFSDDQNFVHKFKTEAQSAASLSHINIVNVFDVVQESDLHYIVMELIEGVTLKEFIKQKGPLEIEEAVEIAIQIASGIEHAHKNKIIHRDIKPQNIMISYDGIIKVTDFGIARAASSSTITANATGSVHYISPEQARGGYTDEKSDIYSLGITLFEMLTGKLPYEGDNNVSIALQHIQGDMVNPRDINPAITPSIESVIIKMIQKKAELRYQNISDVIIDLRRAVINPNEIIAINNNISNDAPTVMMTKDEVAQIKSQINDRKDVVPSNKNDIDDKSAFLKNQTTNGNKGNVTEKIFMAFAIILAILIVAGGAIFAIGKINESRKSKVTEIPTIEGLTLEEAEAKLNEYHLELGEVNYDYHDTIESGVVVQQGAEPGLRVDIGVKIHILVSKGIQTFKVPNVQGMQFNIAESTIRDANLKVKTETEANDTVKIGEVIRQYPSNGNLMKDEIVTIVVSTGKKVEEVQVPYLKNLTEEMARKAVEDSKLIVGTVSHKESESVDKGRVIRQSIESGITINEGTVISFEVSLGAPTYYTEYIELDRIFGDFVLGGNVRLELIQGETQTIVFERYVEYDEVPLNIAVNGREGEGLVKLYIDEEFQSKSWSVSFGEGQ